MKKLVHRIIIFILRKFSIHEKIKGLNSEDQIQRCIKSITSDQAVFYSEAKVYNLQNDPKKIHVGKNTHIRGILQIFAYGGEISIGDNSYVGDNSRIWSGENITIGNNVLISHFVNIIDSNSHEIDFKERAEATMNLFKVGHPTSKGSILTSPIIIEDYVWISYNVSIMKGVRIGMGAIVAAGSVVTKDIPPLTLVAGNPARVIKSLE